MELCKICNAGEGQPYGQRKWKIGDREYSLLQCASCGSVFSDPIPDDDTLAKLYKTGFNYTWYEDHYDAKYKDCEIRIKEYSGLLGKRVLDFGGGMGYFSKAAEKAGYISKTYDPFLNTKDRIAGKWDTIVLLHVLEHFNNPDKAIGQIKNLLEPGGNVIIAVPNFSCLGFKELGMGWIWAQAPLAHIFHFTAAGLQKLLSRHGFANLAVSYHERWDANLYTELKELRKTRKMDKKYWKRPFNWIPRCRKMIAKRNSSYKFEGLQMALKDYDPSKDIYAELQVTATLAG